MNQYIIRYRPYQRGRRNIKSMSISASCWETAKIKARFIVPRGARVVDVWPEMEG